MTTADHDNRRAQRRRVLKGARVVFNEGYSTMDCTLRNVSSTGGLIVIESSVGMPDEFELLSTRSNQRLPCKVVWRKVNAVGFRFRAAVLNPDIL